MFNPTLVPGGHGQMVMEVSSEIGLSPSILAAIGDVESRGNANAVSPTGSKGWAQINPDYHQGFFQNNDWRDARANARYGGLYFKQQLQKYGDPIAAAMAYNGGPAYYDAYLRGEVADSPKLRQMLDHGKKFGIALSKYGGANVSLNNPNLMRTGHSNMKLTASANSYVGMDTSDGPDAGRNACVWALNKVMRAAGMEVPWGNSLYVPFVKGVLDKTARRVSGPMPGAIAIMQDNHPTDPYPHIGIVGADGMIISNSTSRARFDWKGTPQEYEQKYGRPNLYYMLN